MAKRYSKMKVRQKLRSKAIVHTSVCLPVAYGIHAYESVMNEQVNVEDQEYSIFDDIPEDEEPYFLIYPHYFLYEGYRIEGKGNFKCGLCHQDKRMKVAIQTTFGTTPWLVCLPCAIAHKVKQTDEPYKREYFKSKS